MTKNVTDVLTEESVLETAVKLIELGGETMNAEAYRTAGTFVQLSIAISLKRLADLKEQEIKWQAGDYGPLDCDGKGDSQQTVTLTMPVLESVLKAYDFYGMDSLGVEELEPLQDFVHRFRQGKPEMKGES